jgi:glycyl-tRNA synthetase
MIRSLSIFIFYFFFLLCRARYEDAKFFYELDTKKKISEFRSQLKGILFHVSYFILDVSMRKER